MGYTSSTKNVINNSSSLDCIQLDVLLSPTENLFAFGQLIKHAQQLIGQSAENKQLIELVKYFIGIARAAITRGVLLIKALHIIAWQFQN